jgi:RNA polymerase sigma factor (sigma-70 family)
MALSAELLQKCLQGDRQSQFNLYRQYHSFLMGICYRYTNSKDDAQHLVNEGFFKILTKIEKYNPDIPFELWIRRIMINTVIDQHRQNGREKRWMVLAENVEAVNNDHPVSFNQVEAEIEAEQLDEMLKKLPEASRKVFNLFAIDGYAHKEIGSMLGISEGTSKWHLNNARQLLKQYLGEWLKKNGVTVYEARKHA